MTAERDRPFVLREPAPPAPEEAARPLVVRTEEVRERETIAPAPLPPAPPAPAPARRGAWPAVAMLAGLFGVMVVGAVAWVDALMETSAWLAVAGATAATALLSGLAAWGGRELRAVARLDAVQAIRARLAPEALPTDRALLRAELALVAGRLARRRVLPGPAARWLAGDAGGGDARDLVLRFETTLLAEADRAAVDAVRRAARDATALTAISPTALTDSALFAARAVRLVRAVATAYGHRPTRATTAVLVRRALGDIALLTGADLAADALVGTVGGGVLERLSSTAATGLLAGYRMARLGQLAIEASRPMPFLARPRPSLRDLTLGLPAPPGPQDARGAGR